MEATNTERMALQSAAPASNPQTPALNIALAIAGPIAIHISFIGLFAIAAAIPIPIAVTVAVPIAVTVAVPITGTIAGPIAVLIYIVYRCC